MTKFIGAEHYGREQGRLDYLNGSLQRSVDTCMGTIDLKIPRARETNFVPPLLEHRKCSERALFAVVQEMVINGVSSRKVERVPHEFGVERMSKSQVSLLCVQLDGAVRAFSSASSWLHTRTLCSTGSTSIGFETWRFEGTSRDNGKKWPQP